MATKKPTNTKAAAQKTPLTAKIDRMIEREDATVKAYASVNIGGAFVIKDIASPLWTVRKGCSPGCPFAPTKPAAAKQNIPTLPSPSPMRQDRVLTTPFSALTVRLWRNPRTNYPMRTRVLHKRCDFFLKSADFAGLSEFFRYPVGRGGKYEKNENARSPPRRTDAALPCKLR